ncbi:hypothetical protein LOC67_24650 [Stieleria sp. JC731]|uniref:hypothetical protein n=1 Tax=Pirellulaceae TaxID=2691357 RepID=UPI001E49AB8B|nr:hypothetical protein [Stieleria sp. JC731]MCC9603753.1 hypothetical protein [Stieleria sp. JC731]
MANDNSKADRKCRRKLGAIAWKRELSAEIHKLADAICAMDAGDLSPHDVNDQIHEFHDGISRELWRRYTQSDPGASVYRAHYDGYLTDDDLVDATQGVRDAVREFADLIRNTTYCEPLPEIPDGG